MQEADHALVARVVAARDTAAFGELVRRHQGQVRGFLRRLTGEPASADDLAQDTFMQAWHHMQDFSGRGSFIGWLLKIAYRAFLQAQRKSRRYTEVLARAGREPQVEQSNSAEHRPELERLLAILSDEERAILLLSYACGLSHREISEAVELPLGTVKSVIARSKDTIRSHFGLEDHQYG